MNLKHSSACAGLLATGLLAWATMPAQAFNFTTGNNVGTCASVIDFNAEASYRTANGLPGLNPLVDVNNVGMTPTCKTADGFTLTSGVGGTTGGNLQAKYLKDNIGGSIAGSTDNRVVGIGVNRGSNDPVPGEISVGEYLDLGIDGGGVLESIDLNFLYGVDIFGDKVAETAKLTATDMAGNLITEIVTPILGGTGINNLSASAGGEGKPQGGGWYSILNPFGDLIVKNVRLEALISTSISETWNPNSDFSLVGAKLKSTSVPEPASLLGLGLVAGSLAATRRRHPVNQKA